MRLHQRVLHKLELPPSFFAENGDIRIHDISTAREAAGHFPGHMVPTPTPGLLMAGSLIHEIQHRVIHAIFPGGFPSPLLAAVKNKIGPTRVEQTVAMFQRTFPDTVGEDSPETLLEEMWLLRSARNNPAFQPLHPLFPDQELRDGSEYMKTISTLEDLLKGPEHAGPDISLPDLLAAPTHASPDSLAGQLEFIRREWATWITDLLPLLDGVRDLTAEERSAAPPPKAPMSDYWKRPRFNARPQSNETESFSRDSNWMENLVLVAKHTHVWLHQLSNSHGRSIETLDQIPDEELRLLANQGFSGIWLVGLWERSPASQRIKELCGQSGVMASAYALSRYTVAQDLGGEAAFRNLSHRARGFGIRLAADMVPNHMGLDAPLVVNHPEYFIQRPDCPYPSYSFTGPELSKDPRTSIQIEDHYFDHSDAAVVFRVRNRENDSTRYVYHGNDGTHIPWNDTAQLDFLREDVQLAALEHIRQVARQVPIIRFDAAMTLTRHHFQRLWYPIPGHGGAIPSRAESAMARDRFDQLMPREFWHRVRDMMAEEFPDTLLMAEAFWLMEGYFVRRLGMHRVYNSAFMHMLRDEDNEGFRKYIRETWNESPGILQRYVNFMSNPDEEPVARQFGNGDKYLGICVLMLTLPGLPMFAHGQVAGFTEKYGMEFNRPNSQESADPDLLMRHESVIFPLMRRRSEFSGVSDLEMYTLVTDSGNPDENVLAFSRGSGPGALVILTHNRFAETGGRIHRGELRASSTLAKTLQIPKNTKGNAEFTDLVTGQSFSQNAHEIRSRGLHFKLHGYGFHLLEYRGFTPVQNCSDAQSQKRVEIPDKKGYILTKSAKKIVEGKSGKAKRQTVQKKRTDSN